MLLARTPQVLGRWLFLPTLAALGLSMSPWTRARAQEGGRPPEVKTGYVHVGPDSLYFEQAGSGPDVILIHDGLVHHGTWDEQMPVFSREFHVVRYDRRGFGASSVPAQRFSNVDDLEAVMAHLDVKKACLVGMSAGGRLAIDFALAHPDQVRCLLLVGAVVSGFGYTSHFVTRSGRRPLDRPWAEQVVWFVTQDPYTIEARHPAVRERVKKLVEEYPVNDVQYTLEIPPERPALGRLSEIHVPTLVLVGESDIPDVHAHAGAIAAGIPGADRDVIPGAGHLIPIERPDEFNRRALEFLRGIPVDESGEAGPAGKR